MIPTRIIIHHSLTQDSKTVSWGAIRNYHKGLGWKDIGYHYGIENLRGDIEILVGRFSNESGAHCKYNNIDSIGICFVGNFDKIPVPPKQWNKGVALCKYLMKTFSIQIIQGHTDLNPAKSCPGKLFNLAEFKRQCYE